MRTQAFRGDRSTRERDFFSAWSKNGGANPGCSAKRPKRTFAGVEKSRVAHGLADGLRGSDDFRIASGGPQDAQHSRVEHGRDLGQSGGDRDFADAQNEFAQDMIDAVSVSFRLAWRIDGADP